MPMLARDLLLVAVTCSLLDLHVKAPHQVLVLYRHLQHFCFHLLDCFSLLLDFFVLRQGGVFCQAEPFQVVGNKRRFRNAVDSKADGFYAKTRT